MSTQPCRPEEITDANRRKEYTLIATDLLEKVLTDPKLNAQTTKLWQILFNKSRYNSNLEIKISYSYLGKKLGKSTRTIARYINSLQNSGYLVVKHNFDSNGGQRPSTISVRVPEVAIEQVKKRKDRLTPKHSNTNGTLIKNSKECASANNDNFSVSKSPVDDIPAMAIEESITVLCGTLQNRVIEESKEQQCNTLSEATPAIYAEQQDKLDRGKGDRNVIHKDNNKKDINKNNNNTVVVPLPQNDPQKILQEKINSLEKHFSEESRKINTIKDNLLRYNQIKKAGEIEGTLHVYRITLERIEKEIHGKSTDSKTEHALNSDSSFFLNKSGERPVPQGTFKRLTKSLELYGYQGHKLNCLMNEIIFEARFGTLVKCNRTKNVLSVDNAINIGLKLVRENRWSTPALIKKYAHASFSQP